MTFGIGWKLIEVRDVLGEDTETMSVGTTVFVDRPVTIEEKMALERRITPRRMKNIMDLGEARIEM